MDASLRQAPMASQRHSVQQAPLGVALGQTACMRIDSVRAEALRNPAVLGRSSDALADWHDESDHMNPLGADPRFKGQASRFQPPWGDVMCVVTTCSGQWGLGMSSLAGITAPLINDYLAPMLCGESIDDHERLWEMMTIACGSHFGASGVASYAISAVDLALWDVAGKVAEKPVYKLLGAADPSPVRCYATGMDLEWFGELGFEAFKLPCPWGPNLSSSIDRLVDLVGTSRELVGPSADLMLDCWAIQSVDHAICIGEAMSTFDLGWIEDMIYPEDWVGYSRIRSALPSQRLAAGERWYTDLPFLRAIESGWVDVLQPDPLWLGGATPCLRVARAAADAGYDLAVHCGANDSYGQHLSAALPGNLWAEMYINCPRDSPLMNSYRATPGMSFPENGRIQPSDAPGFGIELTLNDIERATT